MDEPSGACVFCRIIDGDARASIVCQDDLIMAFMDTNPVNPGHVLIVPKQHYAYLQDVPETVAARIFVVGRRIAASIRQSAVRCEGVNMFVADGEAAFQEVLHFHLHVFPRFHGDPFRIDADWSVRPPRDVLDDLARAIGDAYSRIE